MTKKKIAKIKAIHFTVVCSYTWSAAASDGSWWVRCLGGNEFDMKRYKASRYNIIVHDEDDIVVFNSRTCALAKVSSLFINLLEAPNSRVTEAHETLAFQMFESGFLVSEEADELQVLEYEYNEARYAKNKLSLAILPSFDCNFRCFYCFEDKKACVLSDRVVDGIKKFVSANVTDIKALCVCWFGGEPLLNPGVIWELSDFFIKIAKERGFEYESVMISNGSLIDEDVVDSLKEAQISSVQITIDGDQSTHDRRRCFADGHGSYCTIMDNIRLLTEKGVKVICRVNLDKTNRDGVINLIEELGKKSFNNFQMSFGHLQPLGNENLWFKKVGYSADEFACAVDELTRFADRCGLNTSSGYPSYPRPMKNFCGACQVNSYVIHPNGDLHKCFDCIDYKIGDIYSGVGESDVEKSNLGYWMKHNPFKDNECLSCNVLPICMGSCPYLSGMHEKKFCLAWKSNIENVVLRRYEASKRNK